MLLLPLMFVVLGTVCRLLAIKALNDRLNTSTTSVASGWPSMLDIGGGGSDRGVVPSAVTSATAGDLHTSSAQQLAAGPTAEASAAAASSESSLNAAGQSLVSSANATSDTL